MTEFGQAFNAITNAMSGWHDGGGMNYIPYPGHLCDRGPGFIEEDIGALRVSGCKQPSPTVEKGVCRYIDGLTGKFF